MPPQETSAGAVGSPPSDGAGGPPPRMAVSAEESNVVGRMPPQERTTNAVD